MLNRLNQLQSVVANKLKAQSVKAGTKILPHSKVLLLTDGDVTMPDMTGWTKEDVLAFEDLTHIKVSTKGNGFVTNQNVTKGQTLKSKDKIEVTLSADKTDENDDESDDTGSDKQSKSDDKSSDKHKSDSSSKSDSKNSSSSDSKKTPIAIQIINQVPMTIVNGTE